MRDSNVKGSLPILEHAGFTPKLPTKHQSGAPALALTSQEQLVQGRVHGTARRCLELLSTARQKG